MVRQNTDTSSPTALSANKNHKKLLMNPTVCMLSHIILQFRRGTPAEQDHALCRQDRKVKVFSEGHWDGVHKEEDGGDVQHSSSPHCGSARVPGHAGHQHSTPPYRQNMVRSELIWSFGGGRLFFVFTSVDLLQKVALALTFSLYALCRLSMVIKDQAI